LTFDFGDRKKQLTAKDATDAKEFQKVFRENSLILYGRGNFGVPSAPLRTGSSTPRQKTSLNQDHSGAALRGCDFFVSCDSVVPLKAGLKSSLFLTRHSAAAPCRAIFIRACRHLVPFDTNLSGLNWTSHWGKQNA